MSTITLRSVKGSELTATEIDANFTNLNTDKSEKASPTFTGTVTLPNSLVNVTTSSYPTVQPSLNLDFANSKQLDPRITFVRNSTAAYYDGQTTALAEQNLVTYSQTFANAAWVAPNAAVTSGITAPDGTTTANKLIEGATTSTHALQQSVTTTSGVTLTLSIFLKADTRTWAGLIYFDGTSNLQGYSVKLSTGELGTQYASGVLSSSITNAGNGWYRVSITVTTTSTLAKFAIYPLSANNTYSYAGDGTSGIYIWGAQLEQRSSVTAYTPTTTSAITNYIPVLMTAPANVARFDCDPITRNSLGLLIEESRTNLLTYSSDFTNAAWTLTNATLTSTANIAPDGTQTAFNLVDSTATGLQTIAQTYTKAASAIAYTSSVYFKANQRTYSWLQISDGAGNGAIVYFNLTTGVISTAVAGIGTAFTSLSATITLVGNSWYRCTITGTSNTATSLVVQFGSSTNGTSNSFTGNSYSGIYIWGAQLEAGSFATSYIPTVASTVSRAADQASMTGANFSSWYNQAQGSLYAESDDNGSNNNAAATLFNMNTPSYNLIAFSGPGVLNQARLLIRLDTGGYVINTTSSTITQPIKQAASFKDGAVSCTANGSLFVTNQNVNIPHSLNGLYIGYFSGTVSYLTGHIKKISYYPVALSSSNLVALTS